MTGLQSFCPRCNRYALGLYCRGCGSPAIPLSNNGSGVGDLGFGFKSITKVFKKVGKAAKKIGKKVGKGLKKVGKAVGKGGKMLAGSMTGKGVPSVAAENIAAGAEQGLNLDAMSPSQLQSMATQATQKYAAGGGQMSTTAKVGIGVGAGVAAAALLTALYFATSRRD